MANTRLFDAIVASWDWGGYPIVSEERRQFWTVAPEDTTEKDPVWEAYVHKTRDHAFQRNIANRARSVHPERAAMFKHHVVPRSESLCTFRIPHLSDVVVGFGFPNLDCPINVTLECNVWVAKFHVENTNDAHIDLRKYGRVLPIHWTQFADVNVVVDVPLAQLVVVGALVDTDQWDCNVAVIGNECAVAYNTGMFGAATCIFEQLYVKELLLGTAPHIVYRARASKLWTPELVRKMVDTWPSDKPKLPLVRFFRHVAVAKRVKAGVCPELFDGCQITECGSCSQIAKRLCEKARFGKHEWNYLRAFVSAPPQPQTSNTTLVQDFRFPLQENMSFRNASL